MLKANTDSILEPVHLNTQVAERNFDSNFYNSFSGNSIGDINNAIEMVGKWSESSKKAAYKGALLMKKAAMMKVAKEKLEAFKEGRGLLENEIKNNPENIEYLFLRLVIQENAPEILKYNNDIPRDKDLIIKGFATLDQELKKEVLKYAENSAYLNKDLLSD